MPQRPFSYDAFFARTIEGLQSEGRYRVFANIARHVGEFPVVDLLQNEESRKVTVWCSNDYLGMGQHEVVLQAMETALRKYGAGAGGTRNISGTYDLIVELEEELADLHDKDSALVFTSGFVANQTSLCALGSILPNCIILSDSMNHASMIEGIRQSKAEKLIFQHNSVEHLEQLLQTLDRERPKIIAFESVYSMDGDISPMEKICDLADRYGAITYLDETHAVGLYGHKGGGLAQQAGITDRIDILQGGIGKAFGVVGGFVTGSKDLIDCIRSYGTGFIFTTTLPPVVAAGAIASIRHLKSSSVERERHQERVATTRRALKEAGIPVMPTPSHILPVPVGDSFLVKELSDRLLNEFDIYVQPINYPTVPRGTERLRITPSPFHSDEMIAELVRALSELPLTNRQDSNRNTESLLLCEISSP